jgi:hypothetical protein
MTPSSGKPRVRPERGRARLADDAEKAALWSSICAVHPDLDAYQERTEWNIPVLVCSPVTEG